MTLLGSTLAYCPSCHATELARIVAREGGVFMERLCGRTGVHSAMIASDYRWYVDRTAPAQDMASIGDPAPSRRGCPFDCGLCQWHSGALRALIVHIGDVHTPAEPKPVDATRVRWRSPREIRRTIASTVDRLGAVRCLSMEGPEPMRHPEFFEILEACRHEKIDRVNVLTDGLQIAQEHGVVERLKNAGIHVELRFDPHGTPGSHDVHDVGLTAAQGAALDTLEFHDLATTVRIVCIKNVNKHAIAPLTRMMLARSVVDGVTLAIGDDHRTHGRLTIDEVEALVSAEDGSSRSALFASSSCHPLCMSAATYAVAGRSLIPLSPRLDPSTLERLAWRPGDLGAEELRLEFERRMNVRTNGTPHIDLRVKQVMVHATMDVGACDIDRASRCGDLVVDGAGRLIPHCLYDVIPEYREVPSAGSGMEVVS